jgi:hypothetical protein
MLRLGRQAIFVEETDAMTKGENSHKIPGLAKLEQNLDERVRRRAYEIWLEEGQPEGRDLDHWSRAEQELTTASDLKLAEGEITSLSESD